VSCHGARAAAPTRPRASSRRCSRKDLGQPFNVVNRTGGSGVVGHSAIATGTADGYTIGMLTVEITMMHWQG
jgi:tripartite-type tricarboxylate transporter receptor subunit TctC